MLPLLLALAAAPPPDTTVTAFVNVTVVPMDAERVLPGQTVVVRDGRIAEVGAAGRVRVPRGARVVDGAGKWLMPGLAEMHAHVPGGQAPDAEVERVLALYALNGLTTVRGMLGHPRHLEWRARLARGEAFGPRLVTSGPSLNGTSVPDWATARRLVEEQHAAGYDFLKIHPGIGAEAFDTLAATAARLGMRFAGHVPLAVGLDGALRHRFWTIDHLDGYAEAMATGDAAGSQFFGANLVDALDESRMASLVARTRAAGVAQVPTQVLFENLASPEPAEVMAARPEHAYVPKAAVPQWVAQKQGLAGQLGAERLQALVAMRRRLLKAMHDGGVPIVLGSDAPQVWNVPGFSTHRELAAYVAAGLTPYQALRTGTVAVAALLGEPGTAGTVAAGRRADLLLLDGNPLEDVAHAARPAGVMVAGRWVDGAERARRLAAVAAAYAN
jgi:imidazolonepropionase-like amidohydrolase